MTTPTTRPNAGPAAGPDPVTGLAPGRTRAAAGGGEGEEAGEGEAEEELVQRALQAYGLSAAQVEALAEQIAAARLAAFAAGYTRHLAPLQARHRSRDVDRPSAAQAREQRRLAHERATQIAATYHAELEAQARAQVQQVLQASARGVRTRATGGAGEAEGVWDRLRAHLSRWARERLSWKGEQVASVEVGEAADAGTGALLADVAADEVVDDASGDALTLDDVLVSILPETGVCPECAEHAGRVYAAADADLLPPFPLHPGCEHERVLLSAASTEPEEEPLEE